MDCWTQLLCATFTAIVAAYYFIRKKTKYLALPGPKSWPIIGCFLEVDKVHMHLTLNEWGYKFDTMFRLPLLGRTMLVINTSELARKLYMEEPTATLTSGRPRTYVATNVVKDLDVILTPYSEKWKKLRKITYSLLHTYGKGLQKLESNLLTLLDNLRGSIEKEENTVVNPEKYVDDYILGIVEIMITGDSGNKELQKLIKEIDDSLNSIGTSLTDFMLTLFPWIRFLPCKIANDLKWFHLHHQRLMCILEETMRLKPDAEGIYQSFVKMLEDKDRMESAEFTMDNVGMIMGDLILASYMTTASSILSLIKILMSKKDVQLRVQEETDREIGISRSPRLRDRDNCPYTEATILETLRYISHLPITVHSTLDEFKFQGIHVPKGCDIIVNTWHAHHNAAEWTDPFDFKPERFLDGEGNLLPATHPIRKRLMIFGFGKRSCIGEVMAKSRIFLFLSALMQLYTVEPPTDEPIPLFHQTDMKPGGILFPTEYECRFRPREKSSVRPP